MQGKTINEAGRKDGERITNGLLLMGRGEHVWRFKSFERYI